MKVQNLKKERGKGDYKQEKKEENKDEGEEEEEEDEEEEEEENSGEEENNEETKDQEENKYRKQNESKSLYNICDIDFSIGNDNKKSNNNELDNTSEKEEKEIRQKSIGGLSDIKKIVVPIVLKITVRPILAQVKKIEII